MASACVNNITVSPPESNFQPTPTYSSRGWLTDPPSKAPALHASNPPEIQETAAGDFEFRLEEDPVTMLPADELFSDGKLVPLHFSTLKQNPPVNVSSQETPKPCRPQVETEISEKATRSSSRWREFLGLKKSSQNTNNQAPKSDNNPKSLKHFFNRSSKADSSLHLPLLKDSDNYEPVPVSSSSRLSLSSSSSSHEHEDLPRLSLDSEKPSFNNNPSPNPFAPCRMRIVKPKAGSGSDTNNQMAGGGSGSRTSDSPRMNSSGKIMFQSLERSSSSPSSLNGGPRFKQRGGMERSYSANVTVRVAPVLNVVPLRGASKSASVFGFFSSSSPQKSANGGSSKGHQSSSRSKTADRNQ
ncbi:hypothetical protein V6N13_114485 [Hibiscus sabdariffa]|uniref:Uncharacterized protein n=1 Tax=Hibiscus sabdariffa TaxID=183260 RepID=A0ABR2U205_9ROSI